MLIGGVPGGPGETRPSRRGAIKPDAGGSFTDHLPDIGEAREAPALEPAVATAAAGTIMVMPQPERSDEARDRQAKRHGQALLGALRDLQLSVLGDGSGNALEALTALSRLTVEAAAADPRLQAAMHAISQRAAVELAKAEGRSC